jgi:hypothetical protein
MGHGRECEGIQNVGSYWLAMVWKLKNDKKIIFVDVLELLYLNLS